MRVKINAGSRIHLGFIDPSGVSGRRWGSVGLYLNEPRLSIICEKSEHIDVHGPEWLKEIASMVCESLKIHGLKIRCEEYIPRHVGLGSGTQTILSIALAASQLYSIDIALEDIAIMFGRCRRSGAGYWLFQKGGLTIDAGATSPLKPPTLLFRSDFPKDWKVLLAVPNIEGLGLHSDVEEERFKNLSTRPVKDASLTILMKLLPSLIEEDFSGFTEAVEELDFLTSSFFEEVQSGPYHPLSGRVVELFRKSGLRGVGQSSWGPTIYGFIRGDEVESLIGKIKPVEGFRYILTTPRNYGAQITEL